MVTYIFFKMATTLDFQNFNFSTVTMVKRVEMHHYAKFCRNCFNIMLVWLENAYSHLFFGGFWFTFPPDDVTHHPNPKKDRLLV